MKKLLKDGNTSHPNYQRLRISLLLFLEILNYNLGSENVPE